MISGGPLAALRVTLGALCVFAGAAWGAGCAPVTVSLREGPRAFTPDDYGRIYERWTRDEESFSFRRIQDVLNVTATFESWSFRWAYVVRYADDYGLVGDDRETLLRTSLEDARSRHRFFVTLSGLEFREQQLTSPRSAWRVLLVDPQGRVTPPVEIIPVRRPSAAEQVYFPTISPLRAAFRIVFPALREDGSPVIPRDATEVRLRFTGARGRVDLVWALTPGGADPALAGLDEAGTAAPAM